MRDVWEIAGSYERYIGRWSRAVAREFVARLSVPSGGVWIDVGCGSGALTAAILDQRSPALVLALDRSIDFTAQLRRTAPLEHVRLVAADAMALPFPVRCADAVVSALVLNFVPDPELAVREMLRCARPGGIVATYLWDYSEGMQAIRLFWDAAIAADERAIALDEANRFPICRPEALENVFRSAGALDVSVDSITVPTRFRDFDDLWSPFLGGQGPAPAYAMSLPDAGRAALRERFRTLVQENEDGSIDLSARAWFARARRPVASHEEVNE